MFRSKISPAFMQGVLAVVVIVGFFGVLFIVIGKPDMRDAMLILVGQLSGCLGAVVAYYFGSSKGSAQKNELLAKSIPADSQVKED